ncbi:hypothetical protein E1B28_012657 [Marasmius oreades]|uniref:Uncharacterized protein n=1 Tax=Marasmius oreades TaxID=181124 RepID=A0A9P7RSZ9_9AGAR|nr:uncharacterized protein E1B28_012657 [Marasmius oreades]KAG7088686.1 hypothetical protein E1B28_012657 [Marasmius oreades]
MSSFEEFAEVAKDGNERSRREFWMRLRGFLCFRVERVLGTTRIRVRKRALAVPSRLVLLVVRLKTVVFTKIRMDEDPPELTQSRPRLLLCTRPESQTREDCCETSACSYPSTSFNSFRISCFWLFPSTCFIDCDSMHHPNSGSVGRSDLPGFHHEVGQVACGADE